jgi:hypothetical protein
MASHYIVSRTYNEEWHERLDSAYDSIRITIEKNNNSLIFYDEMLAEKLRVASIAIQNVLPPHIKDITNDQLVDLKNKLNIDEISLLIKNEDQFVNEKSTDPSKIGKGNHSWGEKWNQMLSQLMVNHSVILDGNYGQTLPGFWAGTLDRDIQSLNKKYKLSYYNDGTTDYIINLLADQTERYNFQIKAGIDGVISDLDAQDPAILEITILNFNSFSKVNKDSTFNSTVLNNPLLVNGSYNYVYEKDKEFAQQAISNNEYIHKLINLNDKKFYKSYMPLSINVDGMDNNKLIAVFTTDFDLVKRQMKSKQMGILFFSLLSFVIGLIFIIIFYFYIRRKAMLIDQMQSMYVGNLNRMFQTIKEHRHDFNHHLFTLQGLVSLKQYDDAETYVRNLTKIQRKMKDIVHINIPAFNGLLQTKLAESIDKQINFEYHFEGFESINLDIDKTTHIVRILGNILDNAFHAVQENDESDRKVVLMGKIKGSELQLKIHNNGPMIPVEIQNKIFEFGFTTKIGRGGTGIGLASSRKIIKRYKGRLDLISDEEFTTFIINIPVSNREISQIT